MAKIYAALIIAGKKKFSEVPEQIKEDVKNILKEEVVNDKITPELFQELVGEAYIME